MCVVDVVLCFFFFQAEDGIRDLVRSRGLGDVYKRQGQHRVGVGLGLDRQQCGVRGTVDPAPRVAAVVRLLSLIHI